MQNLSYVIKMSTFHNLKVKTGAHTFRHLLFSQAKRHHLCTVPTWTGLFLSRHW